MSGAAPKIHNLRARRGLAGDEPREMGIPHLKRLALLALVASLHDVSDAASTKH
jgi:hypothetical protein